MFQTVLSGVLVFVCGQVIQKFWIEPFQDHMKVIGKIDNRLKYYENVLAYWGLYNLDRRNQAADEMRQLSCELEATFKQVPFLSRIKKMSVNVATAAQNLILLGNPAKSATAENEHENLLMHAAIEAVRSSLNIPKLT